MSLSLATTRSPALDGVDIYDPATYKVGIPHDQYRILRKEAPLFFQPEPDGPGYWAVTRHRDIVEISRNPKVFSSEKGGINIPDTDAMGMIFSRMIMITMDPPQHTQLRKLVSKGFTPRMARRLEGSVQAAVTGILDEVEGKDRIDFVTEISSRLPLFLIADMMGWPEEDRERMYDWADRVARIDDAADSALAAMEFWDYCLDFIDDIASGAREVPEDTLVRLLMRAEIEGQRLSDGQILGFLLLLAIGGNETTRNCISGGFLALDEFPEQRRDLIAHFDEHGDTAVEEMLRWTSPIICFRRTVTEPVTLLGQRLREGEKVVLYYASGNRDESIYDEPDRFDIRRDPNPHLSFGTGQHFCLGASLARMEIRALFAQLVARFPDMAPCGEVVRVGSNYFNGIDHIEARTGR